MTAAVFLGRMRAEAVAQGQSNLISIIDIARPRIVADKALSSTQLGHIVGAIRALPLDNQTVALGRAFARIINNA